MRYLFFLLGLVLLAAVAAFVGWSRVPGIISHSLSQKMRVFVEVGSMDLGPSTVSIHPFLIGNPPQTILPRAFSAQEIRVEAPLTRYLSKAIVIDQIEINDIYLGLEFNSASGTDGNWTTILGNLQSSLEHQAAPGGTSRSVLIKTVLLNRINTEVVYRKEGTKVRRLPQIPQIALHNISSEGGFPVDQLTNSVLGQMLRNVFVQQNLKNMLDTLAPLNPLNQPQGPLNNILGPFKGFFNTGMADESAAERKAS